MISFYLRLPLSWKIIFTLLLLCAFLFLITKVVDFVIKGKGASFASCHPKLYSLLMFLLGSVIIIIGVWSLKELLLILGNAVTKLISSFPKIDAVILVALITAGVSIFSVIMSSIVSKIIDYRHTRKNYLAQKREGPYGEFIAMVYKIKSINEDESYTNEEMLKDVESFSKQLTLYGVFARVSCPKPAPVDCP